MRVIQVVSAVCSEASGVSPAVLGLSRSISESGATVELAALDFAPTATDPPFLRLFPSGVGPRRLGLSPKLQRWLTGEARSGEVDVIHNHGLWMMPNVYASRAALAGRVPLVTSPHGTMSEWAFDSGSFAKRIFWPLLQRPALHVTGCFHATADCELADICRFGFRQPVAVIPNGIDVPQIRHQDRESSPFVLYLGRLHPKKGLDLLLPAWQRIERRFEKWRLVIAGPDQLSYRAKMERFANQLRLTRIEFVGPLYGEQKWRAYGDAGLFVLPTRTENFAMAVGEALAAGTPAVVTKGAPWAGLEVHQAGWWVDIGIEPLAAALEDALSRPPQQLEDMGRRGRAWVEREFSWASVGSRMLRTYEWLVNGGPRPPWVDL